MYIIEQPQVFTFKGSSHSSAPKAPILDETTPIDDSCCLDPNISLRDGFHVCLNCGMTHHRVFDDAPRRIYTIENLNKRKQAERVTYPVSHRTVFKSQKDWKGRVLNPEERFTFRRLERINKSINNSYERNLWIAIPILDRLCSALNIPDFIAKEVFKIYTFIIKNSITRGRSIEVLVSASLYGAIRVYDIPKTIEDIIELIDVTRKKFNKAYLLITREVLPRLGLRPMPMTPSKYLPRFCSELNIDKKARDDAFFILKKSIRKGYNISGYDPKGICAAIILMAIKINKIKKSQREVALACKSTEVTLRQQVKRITPYFH